jgi:hypothetical protein
LFVNNVVNARLFYYSPVRQSIDDGHIIISNPKSMVTTLEITFEGRMATYKTSAAFIVNDEVYFILADGIVSKAEGRNIVTRSLINEESGWEEKSRYLLGAAYATIPSTPEYAPQTLDETIKDNRETASLAFMREKLKGLEGLDAMSDDEVTAEYTFKTQLIGALKRLYNRDVDPAIVYPKTFSPTERAEYQKVIDAANDDAKAQKLRDEEVASKAVSLSPRLIPPHKQNPINPGQIPFRRDLHLPDSGFRRYTPKLLLFTALGFGFVAYIRWGPRASRYDRAYERRQQETPQTPPAAQGPQAASTPSGSAAQ